MVKGVFCSLVFVFFLSSINAQESEVFKTPNSLFESAFELYDNSIYGASLEKFNSFIYKYPKSDKVVDAKFYIALSKIYLNQTGATKGAEDLARAYPEHRLNQQIYFELGNDYLLKSKYKTASRYLNMVDETSLPTAKRLEFNFNKAYALFKSKKYDKAVVAFQPLTLKESPFYLKSNYYYGYALYQEKNYNGALQIFQKIENKGPQTMKLYIAQIYYLQGKYKEAIIKSNEIKKGHIMQKGQIVIGKSYYKLRDFKLALESFEKSNLTPDSLTAMEQYEVGYTYYKNAFYDKAFEYFSPLANRGDDIGQLASYNLGHCFLKLDKKQSALNAFFEAQRKNYAPTVKEEALFQYAKLSYDLDNTINATSAFKILIEKFPDTKHGDEARSILASLFVNTSDYETALFMIEGIKNWDENTKLLYQKMSLRRGKELINAKDYVGANTSFIKADKYPMDKVLYAESIYWQAELAVRNEQTKEAFALNLKFASLNEAEQCSFYPSAFYNLAYLYYEKEDYIKAKDYFNKVASLKSKYKIDQNKLNDNFLRLGDCNYILKDYEAALEAYSYTTSGARPQSDYALFQKGMIYGLTERSEEKLQVMKRIPQKYPHSIYVQDAIFEIGNEYFLHDKYADAKKNFEYLLSDFPRSSYRKRAMLSLGQIHYNKGHNDKAIEIFKSVVTKFPSTSEAKSASSIIKRIYVTNGRSKEYISWLESLPNSSVRASYKDSVSFDAAEKRLIKGDYAVSLSDFEQYIINYPKGYFLIKAHNYALFCSKQLNNVAKEIEHLTALANAQINEYTESSIYALAKIYRKNKDCPNAINYWDKTENFTKSIDRKKEAQFEKLLCFESQKDTVSMESMANKLYLHKVLTKNQKGKVYVVLGEQSYRLNALVKSKTLFTIVRNEMQNEQGAKSLYYLAKIDFNEGKLDSSKMKILKFGEEFSYYEYWFGKCFLLLSDIYWAKEDAFQAKATLNSVIDNFEEIEIVNEAKIKLATILEIEEGEKIKEIKDQDTIEDGDE